MQLTYRGAAYTLSSTPVPPEAIDPSDSVTTGTFLGARYVLHPRTTARRPEGSIALTYRGVHYLG